MNEVEMGGVGTLGPLRVTAPAYAARTRAGLPAAVRAKLDGLESDALNALAIVRAVGDRLAEVRAEVVAAQQRLAMLKSDGAYRHVDLTNEQAELADAEERVAQLTAERQRAEVRWQSANRVAEACRKYLDLGK
jgi:hypothetical protein